MDCSLRELIAINSRASIQFFFTELKEIVPSPDKDPERLYVASVLAHYAQISSVSTNGMPTPINLSDVFDNYFFTPELDEVEDYENTGAQILLLAGFYRTQMEYRKRHNVRWYDALGQTAYRRAAELTRVPKKREILLRMQEHLPFWNESCMILNRNLRESRYLMRRNES